MYNDINTSLCIAPENDDGNNEYKLRLQNKNLEHLTSQMRFRVNEGCGEAIYTLGVFDEGNVIGLSDEEYTESKYVLDQIAEKNNYTITLLTEQKVEGVDNKKLYEFLVREHNPTKYIDIKVACAGNVDVGKSSLLGVLLTGRNDDGRGRSRLNVFNFQHEVKTGRTSSIAHHILGFDSKGAVVNHDEVLGRKKGWPEIVKNSDKVVTFFDLCGHEKYLKTTILGLTSQFPDLALILVGANMGITKITKEHIFLCLTLKIPFIIVVTKIDICVDRENVMKETVQAVKSLLKIPGVRRIPCDIKTEEDVILAVKNIHSFSTVPLFYVSNVTGIGIPFILQFLNLFNKKPKIEENENKVEFHVEQKFQVPGVGTVIGGQLIHGKICTGDTLLLGPNNNTYNTIHVKSIHCKRVLVHDIDAGRYVCLAVKIFDPFIIHRGNIILSSLDKAIQVREFEAEISVLKSHSTTIKVGYEPVVHTCSVRQTTRIMSIRDKICSRKGATPDDDILRTGDKAKVCFRFCYKPEYVKAGFRILLAEGRVKIIGKIISITTEDCKIE